MKSPERKTIKPSFLRAVARIFRRDRLGDLLMAEKLITKQQLEAALATQRHTRQPLGMLLVKQGAITQSQLYGKLAKQWTMRAAAAGLTVMMQASLPAAARADENEGRVTLASRFNVATSVAPQTQTREYPRLFGATETKSNDISAFKKWTTVISRFEDEMNSGSASNAGVRAWRAEIERLRGKSDEEKIAGINTFLNKIEYVEDKKNYGKSDYWATPVEFLKNGGDCEDYAIAKYASLRALGFSSEQLRIAVVQDEVKNIPHALLVVYSEAGNFVLDNQDKSVGKVETVVRYKPIFSLNSNSWWLHKA